MSFVSCPKTVSYSQLYKVNTALPISSYMLGTCIYIYIHYCNIMNYLTISLFIAGLVLLANCSPIKFGEMTTVHLNSSYLSQETISSINADLENPDILVVTTKTAIITITKAGGSPTLIAGSAGTEGYKEGQGDIARFRQISGLVQLSVNYYIVTDTLNFCLREIRVSAIGKWGTARYAGNCTVKGNKDGHRLDASFSHPFDVVKVGDKLFLTDAHKKVKSLVLKTYQVSSIFESAHDIQYLAVVSSEEFYATADHGVLEVKSSKESWLVGDETTGYYETPKDVTWLSNVLLVANYDRHSLQVIDVDTSSTQRVCTGSDSFYDGPIELCGLSKPNALYVAENKIYIGDKGMLRILPYQVLDEVKEGTEGPSPNRTTATGYSDTTSSGNSSNINAVIAFFCLLCCSLSLW